MLLLLPQSQVRSSLPSPLHPSPLPGPSSAVPVRRDATRRAVRSLTQENPSYSCCFCSSSHRSVRRFLRHFIPRRCLAPRPLSPYDPTCCPYLPRTSHRCCRPLTTRPSSAVPVRRRHDLTPCFSVRELLLSAGYSHRSSAGANPYGCSGLSELAYRPREFSTECDRVEMNEMAKLPSDLLRVLSSAASAPPPNSNYSIDYHL